jgi:glycosyltransferase involved in cell wall biosynthesis
MIEPPLVSVLVVVRNGERFLAAALQSIQAQTYRPIEILVVDGQSIDRTAEIARSFADVRYLRQPDLGISNAYNFGLAHTQGELIAFLSHDDLWTPDKLAVQVGQLLTHPDYQYTVCRIRSFLEPGYAPPAGFRTALLNQAPVAYIMETLVARRELFARVGLLDPDLPTAEDVDWFARVFDAGVVGHICDQVLLHKRVHNHNTSLMDSDNNRQLLLALRHSIQRKHMARCGLE